MTRIVSSQKSYSEKTNIYLLQKLDEIDLTKTFVENSLKKFHQKQSLKISSSASLNSNMNDQKLFDDDVVMKKVFDSQFLMFEE